MAPRLAITAGLLLVLAALAGETLPRAHGPVVLGSAPGASPERRPAARAHSASAAAPAAPAAPRDDAAPALPASLRGTEADGDLEVDASGTFVPTAAALALFDYFLATLGEIDRAGVRALVAAEARRRVPGQEDAVLALFDRYLAFLDAMQAEATALAAAGPLDPRQALERVVTLEHEHFGEPLAATLFGERDVLARVILDGAELDAQVDLAPTERDARRAELEARLPESVRGVRARLRAPAASRAEVAALRANGATEAEVWQARAARFGRDAADRLARLDQQRGIGAPPY